MCRLSVSPPTVKELFSEPTSEQDRKPYNEYHSYEYLILSVHDAPLSGGGGGRRSASPLVLNDLDSVCHP